MTKKELFENMLKKVCKAIFCFTLGCIVPLSMMSSSVFAANKSDTVFICPEFGETNDLPNNVTSTTDVWYEEWSRGNNLNLLNLNGLDAVIAEGLTISHPSGSGDDCVGIYVENADLSIKNVNDLANAGWNKLDVYYKTYMVSSYLETTDTNFAPRVFSAHDLRVDNLLKEGRYSDSYGLVCLEGITLRNFGIILYESEFSFLNDNPLVYKFRPSMNCFEYVGNGWHNSYGKDFVEVYDLLPIDDTCDGLYLFVNSALPEELLTQKDIKSFLYGDVNQSEIGEITLEMNEEGEIDVDIPYSGPLPEATKLVVNIPKTCAYENGTTLYLYYKNDSGSHDFIAKSEYVDGWVTFDLEHCSEYIITDIDHGQNYSYELPTEIDVETTEISAETSAEQITSITEEANSSATQDTETTVENKKSNSKSKFEQLIGVGVGTVVLICATCAIIVWKKKKKR